MDESGKKRLVLIEDVEIGDKSSRLTSVILVLLAAVPVLATVLFGGVDNATWVFITIICACVIMLWLADAWRGPGILLNQDSLLLPVIGLIVVGIIQLLPLGGAGELLSVPVSNTLSLDPYATRFFVGRLLVYLIFFAACLTFINTEGRLKKIVLVVIVFGSLMAFFGILQRLANPEGIYGVRETAQSIPFGPFVNGHHFASFMQMTGGLTLGLLLGKKTAPDRKILLAIVIAIMGVATVLTSSRGGLLGFVSVLAFGALLSFLSSRFSAGRRVETAASAGPGGKIAALAGAVAMLFIIVGVVLFLGGNESLLRGIGAENVNPDVSTGRAHFWPIALRIFFEHPILGAGFDAFGVAFTKHDTWNGQFRVEQAHNDYLQTLADAGIAGFLCIAAFIFLLFRKSLKIITNATGFRRDAAIGALAGCFGILIHSFFDFPLRTPSNAFFFLTLCAVATVSVVVSRSKPRRSTEPKS